MREIWRTGKIDMVREKVHRNRKDRAVHQERPELSIRSAQSCPSGAPRAVHEERPFVPGPGGHSIEIVCLMNFPLAAIAVTTTKSTLDENGQAT